MTLQNASISAGATSMSATGGSAIAFTPDGQNVANGIHLSVAADTDFRTRRGITAKVKQPTFDQITGEYSKWKYSLSYVRPKILSSGKTVFNLVRVEVEAHPESTTAEVLDLNMIGAQLAGDTDFASFWASGSLY